LKLQANFFFLAASLVWLARAIYNMYGAAKFYCDKAHPKPLGMMDFSSFVISGIFDLWAIVIAMALVFVLGLKKTSGLWFTSQSGNKHPSGTLA
jgi:hypothetical protein